VRYLALDFLTSEPISGELCSVSLDPFPRLQIEQGPQCLAWWGGDRDQQSGSQLAVSLFK
jgi:hypothetical protein